MNDESTIFDEARGILRRFGWCPSSIPARLTDYEARDDAVVSLAASFGALVVMADEVQRLYDDWPPPGVFDVSLSRLYEARKVCGEAHNRPVPHCDLEVESWDAWFERTAAVGDMLAEAEAAVGGDEVWS